jgi:hypothetical protein
MGLGVPPRKCGKWEPTQEKNVDGFSPFNSLVNPGPQGIEYILALERNIAYDRRIET